MSEQHWFSIAKGRGLETRRVAVEFTLFTPLYLRHQQTRGRHRICCCSHSVSFNLPSQREWTNRRHYQLHQVVHKLRPEDAEMEKGGQGACYQKALGES